MPRYAFRGNAGLIGAIEQRLSDAGFMREGEVEVADFVITYCTNMTELEDLYFGSAGLLDKMAKDAVAIDMSPATPNFAKEINAMATVSGIGHVEAPLIVKNKVAEEALAKSNLKCFVSGDDEPLGKSMNLLNAIFGDIHVAENVIAAQLARAANTIQTTAEMVSAIEVIQLFRSCRLSVGGVDAKELVPVATSSEAYFLMNAVRESRFNGAYTVEMLLGELSAAITTADDYELIIPQVEAAFHLYELLAVIGGAELSPSALTLVYHGEDEREASKYGLDWARAAIVYDREEGDEGDLDDFEGFGSYGRLDGVDALDMIDYDDPDNFDPYGEDDEDASNSGFGYSVN